MKKNNRWTDEFALAAVETKVNCTIKVSVDTIDRTATIVSLQIKYCLKHIAVYSLVDIECAVLSIVEHEIRFTYIRFVVCDFHVFQILFKCILDIVIDKSGPQMEPRLD